jgi:CRISPR-associated protein Cas5t
MTSKRVARVRIEAPVTSFRYPHFLIGRQPSFDMPPPSTIYGHVASAVGDFPDPASVRFGYHFDFLARGRDLEHQHIITAGGQTFQVGGKKYRTSVQATVQPHERGFLFRPRLTLYLDPPDLANAFRAPVFVVVLGRSQDLAEVVEVSQVDLIEAPGAYLEQTLLPFHYRDRVGFGVTVVMPRYIEPPPERRAYFERYVVLRERIYAGDVVRAEGLGAKRMLVREGEQPKWWVDASTPQDHGVHRGVVFHSFRDN